MTATARLAENAHVNVLSKMWWTVAIRAVLLVAFGMVAYFVVKQSLPNLIVLFAVYCFADGVLSFIGAQRGGGIGARAGLALAGVVSIAASAVALLPDLTWPSFATIVGAWMALRGLCEFVSALTLRKYMERDWSLALIGMFSIIIGVALVLRNQLDPANILQLLAAYSIVIGALMALLARRFRRGLRP